MDKTLELCKLIFAGVGYIFYILFGPFTGLLMALCILAALDYITGLCAAIHSKTISSEIGFRGIAKKVVLFALVSLAHIIDRYLITSGDTIQAMTTLFYIANEWISILENATRIGIPLPAKLKEVLLSMKSEQGNKSAGQK